MKFLKFFILMFLCAAAFAQTDVYIGITSSGDSNVLPSFAMAQFNLDKNSADQKSLSAAAKKVYSVIRADLMFSRYFTIKETAVKVDLSNIKKSLSAANKEKAEYLLTAVMAQNGEDFSLNIYVYHVPSEKNVLARSYKGNEKSLRRLSHLVSDQIILTLTGKRGIADTKLAFSNDSTKHKEIYMVDYDGDGLRKLTADRSIGLLPRWSKDGSIYYTSYRYKTPDIFRINLTEGRVEPVSISQGLDLIGGVSPDGRAVVLTKTDSTNPSIMELDLNTKKYRVLTDQGGVDGSPTYSPDGKFIAFVSNRSGNPQLYVLEIATGNMRRLTSSFNWADSPQWSPTGEWIVFAGRRAVGHPIDIFLVDITGRQIRQLTSDNGRNEDPTWSPDGRFIAFTTTRKVKRQLYVMDFDGSAQHLIADVPGNSFTPHWSF